jgi:hypothetical protein
MDIQSDNLLIYRDLFNLVCGAKLGQGIARTVYVFTPDDTKVVKVEPAGSFQNVMEWTTWTRVQSTKHARWFAPCHSLSNDGRILIMARTQAMEHDRYPVRMPAYFTDFKYGNYGAYKGQLVCHDYGTNLLMEAGMTGRMRRADWWRSEPGAYQ